MSTYAEPERSAPRAGPRRRAMPGSGSSASEVHGPDGHAQGQICRFHADHAVEKLRRAGARPRRVRGRGAGAAWRACCRCPKGFDCSAWAFIRSSRTDESMPDAAGTRDLMIFLLYNRHRPSRSCGGRFMQDQYRTRPGPDRGVAIGGRYGAYTAGAMWTIEKGDGMAAKALSFDVGDYVVYPKHGVGRVVELQSTEIAGTSLDLYVLRFEKER